MPGFPFPSYQLLDTSIRQSYPISETIARVLTMGILHISKLLGHADIRTTQGYLSVKLKELAKELSEKHPRGSMEQTLVRRKEGTP
jgi:hypothetical protein